MLITGNTHTDHRGSIRFVNDFDMIRVVRMYCIEPKLGVIRAWQGHEKETKWFHVIKGGFRIKVRNLDSMELVNDLQLYEIKPSVLEIPPGHYNGFEALEKHSMLMVFSDVSLEESQKDDYRLTLEDLPW